MHLESFSLNRCWCQAATLRLKGKILADLICQKRSSLWTKGAKCNAKSCPHPSGTEVVPGEVPHHHGAVWNTSSREDTWGAHPGLPATKSDSFLTNWDIPLPECSDPGVASIEEKLPWYQMPPNRGTNPASDKSRKCIPVNRQWDLLQ